MEEQAVRQKMEEVVNLVRDDVGTIRTAGASPSLVNELQVAVYGGQQRLSIQELASVTAPDPQTLVIDPWDKSIIGEIRKGILAANIGLNPTIDGEHLRITLPPMTTEDREKYVKLLSTKIENGKIMIRQIRGEAMQQIRDGEISEDEAFRQEKELQNITDKYNEMLEKIFDSKKEELLKV